MKWVVSLLLLVLAIAGLALLHLQYPGTVTLIWLGYQIQFSMIIGLVCFLFLLSVLFFFIRGLLWLIGLPFRWSCSYVEGQTKKARQELLSLITAYEAESYPQALAHQKKAEKFLGRDSLFLWMSGNLFEKANEPLEAEKCFMELIETPPTTFLGLKGKIRMALHKGNISSAYDFLKHAEKLFPHSPWVLKSLLAVLREKREFKQAQDLILRLEDLGTFSAEQSKKQMAYVLYQEAIYPETTLEEKEALLRQSHYLDPSLEMTTEVLVPLLHKQGHTKYAISAIEATWRHDPSQKLGDLYIEITKPKTNQNAYEKAKELVEQNPTSPESLLFQARMAYKAKLWKEAREALAEVMNTVNSPTTLVYDLFAKIELAEKKDVKAAIKWLEEGLQAPRHI